MGDIPIKGLVEDKKPEIPRKKLEKPAETNGTSQTNGKHPLEVEAKAEVKSAKRARPEEVESQPGAKKMKTAPPAKDDDVVVIEDGGAIIIDDD